MSKMKFMNDTVIEYPSPEARPESLLICLKKTYRFLGHALQEEEITSIS